MHIHTIFLSFHYKGIKILNNRKEGGKHIHLGKKELKGLAFDLFLSQLLVTYSWAKKKSHLV